MARKFSARIIINPRNNTTQEMRLLTTPLYEYNAADELPGGAIFGFSTNGTNPDLVLVIEVRDVDGTPTWHYAPARMTTGGLVVKYGDEVVWTAEFSEPGVANHPTWTSFQTRRIPLGSEPETGK